MLPMWKFSCSFELSPLYFWVLSRKKKKQKRILIVSVFFFFSAAVGSQVQISHSCTTTNILCTYTVGILTQGRTSNKPTKKREMMMTMVALPTAESSDSRGRHLGGVSPCILTARCCVTYQTLQLCSFFAAQPYRYNSANKRRMSDCPNAHTAMIWIFKILRQKIKLLKIPNKTHMKKMSQGNYWQSSKNSVGRERQQPKKVS